MRLTVSKHCGIFPSKSKIYSKAKAKIPISFFYEQKSRQNCSYDFFQAKSPQFLPMCTSFYLQFLFCFLIHLVPISSSLKYMIMKKMLVSESSSASKQKIHSWKALKDDSKMSLDSNWGIKLRRQKFQVATPFLLSFLRDKEPETSVFPWLEI